MACSCIRDASADIMIFDPSCKAHEGAPMGDHRGGPPPFKKMFKEAVTPPSDLEGVQKVSWYVGVFIAILIVLMILGALVGLVLGLINWIFL